MPKTVSIVAVGAGNIAHHLIPALSGVPCNILQVYSRKILNASKLAHKVNAEAVNELSKLRTDAELYLVMVPDDDIQDVVQALPKLDKKQYIAHTSGAQAIKILNKNGPNYGSFYALQTFRKNKYTDIASTPFLIDGSNPSTIRFLRSLARRLSSVVKSCTDRDRLNYHIAAVFMNNFINHLSCISKEFLGENNLDPKVILPIAESTFEKILKENPCDIQTGPAIRNDIKLQRKHLKLLDDKTEWVNIYKAISKSIKSRYHEDR